MTREAAIQGGRSDVGIPGTIASVVPDLIIGRANEDAGTIAEPLADQVTAALRFADVSGFTRLTERLAAAGPSGAEDLTRSWFAADILRLRAGPAIAWAGR